MLLRATCSWGFCLLPSWAQVPVTPSWEESTGPYRGFQGLQRKTNHEMVLLSSVPLLSSSHHQGCQLSAVPMGL